MKIPKSLLLCAAVLVPAIASAAAPAMADGTGATGIAERPAAYTNALIHEKSPYLLQHAHNPVDWYPWGDEAFEKARKEDKPIMLSIGYSTCHWCHVMEAESFTQPDVAKVLNDNFVAIKVDREERPDLDEIYMSAVQIVTHSAGWPQTTILLPDGRPYFAATYLPKDRLIEMLARAAKGYREERARVEQSAARLMALMEEAATRQDKGEGGLTAKSAGRAVDSVIGSLKYAYDSGSGGFGEGGPKFPPHTSLSLLLAPYSREKSPRSLAMVTGTLDAMALGGIRDHLGGGFHRYATDGAWKTPHFEKMLYDNALLGRAYADAYTVTRREDYKDAAAGIYNWVLREMTDKHGGFYSAQDADSEGVEGKYYVWTKDQIAGVLGADAAALFDRVYNVRDDGNYKEQSTGKKNGGNILSLNKPLDKVAGDLKADPAELSGKLAGLRARLLAVRAKRVQPGLDDKVLADWNGLMIGSLAHAGKVLGDPAYTDAAIRAAEFFTANMMDKDGGLFHRWRDGEAAIPAFQQDYAFLADGLLDLADAAGDERWSKAAALLANHMLDAFWDTKDGGFFETLKDDRILIRLKNPYDTALPSGNAVAARVLWRLGQATGEARYSKSARATVSAFQGTLQEKAILAQSLVQAAADIAIAPGTAKDDKTAAGGGAALGAGASPVEITATATPDKIALGTTIRIAVKITVPNGWHINAHEPLGEALIPTRVTLAESAGLEAVLAGEVSYPKGKGVAFGADKTRISVYEGSVVLAVPVTVRAAAAKTASILLIVRFQACNDRSCLAPETREVRVPITLTAAR